MVKNLRGREIAGINYIDLEELLLWPNRIYNKVYQRYHISDRTIQSPGGKDRTLQENRKEK